MSDDGGSKPPTPIGLGDELEISDLEEDVVPRRGSITTSGIDGAFPVDVAEAANDRDMDLSEDDSDLSDLTDISDLDEDLLEGIDDAMPADGDRQVVAIDEDAVRKMGVHRRKLADGEGRLKTKSRRDMKRKRPTSTRHEDGDEHVRVQERPQAPMTEEQRRIAELDAKINEAVKGGRSGKRKKADEIDIEKAQDEAIENLKTKMTRAAKADADDKDAGRPAMNKIKMLPEVLAVFAKKQLIYSILENNLLEAVRFWLEPLPDKSLPAYNIQRDLFNILSTTQIKTDYLRQSGLGKIVLFYSKDVRPEPQIRRQAERLVREWSRPILGKSDNYRHRHMQTGTYDPSKIQQRKPVRPLAERANNSLEAPQLKTNRTRMPDNTPVSYNIVPISSQVPQQDPKVARPLGASAEDSIRRMKARLGGPAKKGKKGGLSIEGRGLH